MNNSEFLNEISPLLLAAEKPSRYIGGEYLSMNKDFDSADVKMVFTFPDKYEIGISNFGHKILYHVINSKENFMADRVYAPENDFLKLLIENNKPLYALESKRALNEFDLIGCSLQYEMSYTTLLKMLEVGNIPIFSKDRNENDPFVFAGGPCSVNPMPMADFIDFFMIGDGEEGVVEVCEKFNQLKGKPRDVILEEISKIEGIFCPKFPKKTKRRICELKLKDHPTKSPISHFTCVHDRATVEIRRGCGRLCRFCQSSHINLPIRERNKDDIISLACEYVKNTGYDEYSLLSLSSNDHTNIEEIIKKLNEHFKDTGINVSLPSQRADKFSLNLAKLMSSEKKSAITIAPEAGSQRMRDIINKNLSEEQILNAVLSCVGAGWDKIKFYFIIGLPFEQDEDVLGIIELIKKINSKCRELKLRLPKITCSISVFVPKPHTPFEFCPQASLAEIEHKKDILFSHKNEVKNAKLNVHNSRVSQLEAFFTRGDENISKFIYEMYKNGSYLDSWEENIDFELYHKVAYSLGLDIEKLATKEFNTDENLPWDIIDTGISKSWLVNEYNKAKLAQTTVPCDVKCSNCGVCTNFKTHKVLDK